MAISASANRRIERACSAVGAKLTHAERIPAGYGSYRGEWAVHFDGADGKHRVVRAGMLIDTLRHIDPAAPLTSDERKRFERYVEQGLWGYKQYLEPV